MLEHGAKRMVVFVAALIRRYYYSILISYDEAFDTRVSADLQVRFGGPSTTAAKKKKWENPTINALTATPKNRDVRVHDCGGLAWMIYGDATCAPPTTATRTGTCNESMQNC